MSFLDEALALLSEKIKSHSWLSNYTIPLTGMITGHDKPAELMAELSSFFDAFSEPALAPFRDDYMIRLFHYNDEIIDLVGTYALIGRFIKDNHLLLNQQKNVKNLAIVLQNSKCPGRLATGIVKISDALPFIDCTKNRNAENNFNRLIDHAELWFGNEYLKQEFDQFHNHKLTQAIFDKLVAFSNESISIRDIRIKIAECLNPSLIVHAPQTLAPERRTLVSWLFNINKTHTSTTNRRSSGTEKEDTSRTNRQSF